MKGQSNGRKRLAIIGSVGVPNRYGGPEAFAESISPELVKSGYEVTITCDRSRYLDDLSPVWGVVRRVFIRVRANGALSPLHDFLAFLAVVARSDVVLVLGVSGGLFFPLMRIISAVLGARLLVNIDGVEWRRSKFGPLSRFILFLSDEFAQRCAHVIVYDNEALLPYVRYPEKAVCVEYSGDQAREAPGSKSDLEAADRFALTVCRIEPENNCEMLIAGFLESDAPLYVFVGNWDRSHYGRELRARYQHEPRLRLLDPIYDPVELFRLRSTCSDYLHGHSVGGTNPSLVEILFFDCRIICFDCAFNRSTASDAVLYFDNVHSLAQQLTTPLAIGTSRAGVRGRYTRSAIAAKLLPALNGGQ